MNRYCNPQLEDLQSRLSTYNLSGAAWPSDALGHVNLTYSYNPLSIVPVGGRSSVESAFALWAAVAPLNFVEVPSIGVAGDIEITFSLTNRFPIVGQANSPGLYPTAGDIVFFSGSVGILREVSVHEIGHSLGLGHSEVRDSVMYYLQIERPMGLHADDIAGIQRLYGIGVGSVIPLPRVHEPVFKAPPLTPFPGFDGEVIIGQADVDRDGLSDSVFLAQGAQGHLKVYLGDQATQYLNVLSFPGFYGKCLLATEGERVVVVALLPEIDSMHLKGYVGGVEVSSILVNNFERVMVLD